MIHPSDQEVLLSLLRVSDIPAEIEEEYEIRRRMYHSGGGSGALGIQQLIGVLRHLDIELPEVPVPVQVDWRKHLSEPVLALYGDKKCSGTVTSLGDGGMLICLLDGYEGEVELPRHCVSLVTGGKKAKKVS